MVKVTIECDGKRIVHEGDSAFGQVFSDDVSAHGVSGFAVGDVNVNELPVILAKAAVEQVLKIYEDKATIERLDKLCQFTDKVRELTSKEVAAHKEEVLSYVTEVLGGE